MKSANSEAVIKRLWCGAIAVMAISALLAGAPAAAADAASRLAGLGRAWGTVKLFHPAMAGGDVDWDRALVEAIPLARAAATPEEYKAAVDHMLSFLGDPLTRAHLPQPERTAGGAGAAASRLDLSWPEPGIALLTVRNHLLFSEPGKAEELLKLVREAAGSKAMIMDLRKADGGPADESTSYYLSSALMSALRELISGDIELPSLRYLMHSGYTTQRGSSSGGYFSSYVTLSPSRLSGTRKDQGSVPLVFIVDVGWDSLAALFSGLQISGLAAVIQEGAYGVSAAGMSHAIKLPDGVTVSLRTSEWVNPDGTAGTAPNVSLPARAEGRPDAALPAALDIAAGRVQARRPKMPPLAPVPRFRPDSPYADTAYPAAEYRLMALFRFWTIIDVFFPYKDLLDRPWEETLVEFVPRMEAAADARAYALTVAEMVSRMTDTHGFINSAELREYLGSAAPPLEVKDVEGQTVVTHVLPEFTDKVQGIRIGDIVLAVDGEEIAARRERLGRYIAASTPQALTWRIHQNVLNGPKGSLARLLLRDAGGTVAEKEVPRNSDPFRSARTTPVFSVLPQGYGYIDLARLTVQEVPAAFEAIKATPAVIFDMRGYPRGTAWAITPRLIDEAVAVAKFQRPEPHASAIDWPSLVSFDQMIEPSTDWKYKGRVVVLINEEAISQAEHTCLFLEAAVDARFIGSPTNGANGDVTTMALPGGVYVNFTGHDVRHADGRQLQRVGIQPHVPVKPTIAGIRAGRDEVLEKALAYLEGLK